MENMFYYSRIIEYAPNSKRENRGYVFNFQVY